MFTPGRLYTCLSRLRQNQLDSLILPASIGVSVAHGAYSPHCNMWYLRLTPNFHHLQDLRLGHSYRTTLLCPPRTIEETVPISTELGGVPSCHHGWLSYTRLPSPTCPSSCFLHLKPLPPNNICGFPLAAKATHPPIRHNPPSGVTGPRNLNRCGSNTSRYIEPENMVIPAVNNPIAR
jgi:hypothetical protein